MSGGLRLGGSLVRARVRVRDKVRGRLSIRVRGRVSVRQL